MMSVNENGVRVDLIEGEIPSNEIDSDPIFRPHVRGTKCALRLQMPGVRDKD